LCFWNRETSCINAPYLVSLGPISPYPKKFKTRRVIPPSILSLHFITSSTRNQAVLSPPTSLAVWDQKQICPFLRLKRTFSPWVFWWTPPSPFLSVFPKLLSIEQSQTRESSLPSACALKPHMCKLRSAHSVSVLCQKHISRLYYL